VDLLVPPPEAREAGGEEGGAGYALNESRPALETIGEPLA
jgi:hypothetical protein